MNRNIYLNNMDIDEALKLFMESAGIKKETEIIKVIDSLGRVAADPVFAKYSSPNFNAAAMDGIAVKASDTYGATEVNPIILKKDINYIYVDTGDPIIEPYDSVIMIEDVTEIAEGSLKIISSAYPWQHIRPIGEDIVAHEMIIPSNHTIRAVDIGALLTGGITDICVYRKPQIGIIPTGTEVVEPGTVLELGNIFESNSRMFENLVKEYGGEPKRYKPVPDDYNLLRQTIKNAAKENDIVIINAGSSAGSEDFTQALVKDLGVLLTHGIAAKPGKPAVLGIINDKPILGVPGYPVSAYIVFEIFAKPLILARAGRKPIKESFINAIISRRLVSSVQNREFVRIKIGKVGEKIIATPLNRGAGVTMSLVRADGILEISKNIEGYEAGETVKIRLLKEIEDIENTIVSIGSHDLAMDIIGNLMHKMDSTYNLSSSHVGSMGGIMALKRGETHIAPVHLLDEGSGIYNIPYVKKYLPDKKIALIKGIKRTQGMMIKKGNQKNIKVIEDLLQKDIVFANRQKGAGTRILTDYLLKKADINVEEIKGYEREMTTHMAVAAAVASGSVDVGMGVYSAARAMGLDFIPVGVEDYDFAIPVEFLEENMIQLFLDVITSVEFKNELRKLGGYETTGIGEIVGI